MLMFRRETTGEGVRLIAGQKYTIGNTCPDFPLQKDGKIDKSISRTHATLIVDFDLTKSQLKQQDTDTRDPVVVCNDTSTYGTFLNEGITAKTKVPSKKDHLLKPGDRLRFGLQWNVFKLSFEKLIVLVPNKKELVSVKKPIWSVCGYSMDKWNYDIIPTHFSTDKLEICPELLCSLCKNLPVVKTSFWADYETAIKENSSVPLAKDYFPAISDPEIKKEHFALKDASRRSRLFKGKTFVFTNMDQYLEYKDVVECAGGAASKWMCCTKTTDYLASKNDHIMVGGPEVYTATKDKKKDLAKLADLKKKFGNAKRFIEAKEIYLAVLQCNTDTNCNPSFKISSLIRPRRSTAGSSGAEGVVLAEDTQSQAPAEFKRPQDKKVVPASFEEEEDFDLSSESIITFHDQTTVSTPPTKRPAEKSKDAPPAKVARAETLPNESLETNFTLDESSQGRNTQQSVNLDDEDVFQFDSANALGKLDTVALRAASVEPDEQQASTSRKRPRIESSSEDEDEDPFGNVQNAKDQNSDSDDPFGFDGTSIIPKKLPKKPEKEKSPIRFLPPMPRAEPVLQNSIEPAEEDDFDLDSHWIDTSAVKMEPTEDSDSDIQSRTSRLNLGNESGHSSSVSIIWPTRLGSQKVFRKTMHESMASIPTIISMSEMKKVNCFTGKTL